mgnify:CR=1 FL=1
MRGSNHANSEERERERETCTDPQETVHGRGVSVGGGRRKEEAGPLLNFLEGVGGEPYDSKVLHHQAHHPTLSA